MSNRKNLYSYFNCKTNEELYEKIKNNDPDVKDLVSLYENSDKNRKQSAKSITSPYAISDFLVESKMIPAEGSVTYISLDTKSKITKAVNLPEDCEFSKVFSSIYDDTAVRMMTVYSDGHIDKNDYNSKFENMGYEILDEFVAANKIITSERQGMTVGEYNDKQVCEIGKNKNYHKRHMFEKLDQYNEFSTFYSNSEMIGKNLFADEEKINHLLQVSNANLGREVATVLAFDKDYNITNSKQLFTGGINSAVVDCRHVTKEISDSGAGIVFIHNHPSGDTKPSQADYAMFSRIYKAARDIDKELIECKIIGQTGIYNFTNDNEYSSGLGWENEMKNRRGDLEKIFNDTEIETKVDNDEDNVFWYELRNRGISPGTFPSDPIAVEHNHTNGKGFEFGAVAYAEELEYDDIQAYELKSIDTVRNLHDYEKEELQYKKSSVVTTQISQQEALEL